MIGIGQDKNKPIFDRLKFKLTNTPLLQYLDCSKPFILTTDASGYAIGAIRGQGKLGQNSWTNDSVRIALPTTSTPTEQPQISTTSYEHEESSYQTDNIPENS